jgi:hypothetical protein
MAPPRTRTPVAIQKYFLPTEKQRAAVRQHPAVLLVPVTQAVGGLVLGIIITRALPHTAAELAVLWAAVTLLLIYGGRALARWTVDYFVVTTERVLWVSGFMHRSVEMTPLTELGSMTFVRTFAGRALGFGAFLNGSGTRAKVLIACLPYPEQLYLMIAEMLYPSSTSAEEDYERADFEFTDEA